MMSSNAKNTSLCMCVLFSKQNELTLIRQESLQLLEEQTMPQKQKSSYLIL